MKKLYPMIALLMISTALTAQTRRLIKATTSGNWNSAATWTTVGVPTTPGDNDSVVIAPGVTVTVVGNGNSFTMINSVLDIFGTLIFNEASNANKTNELNFSTTTSNIAVPVIRLGNASSSIAKGLTGNGSGQISVIVNGQSAQTQLKYSTKGIAGVPVGQSGGPTITGPAFAQNTFNQEPRYFTNGSNAALPITLALFKAAVNDNNNVILNWTIAQKINAKSFAVEKSSNGSSWQQIGTMAINETDNKYAYTDAAAGDVNYYRLRMIDLDGKTTYSEILVVRLKNLTSNISLFPNPASHNVNITVGRDLSQQSFTINLFNHFGQLVAQRRIAGGTSVLSFDVSNYIAGNYSMDILFSGGTRETHKLLIVK